MCSYVCDFALTIVGDIYNRRYRSGTSVLSCTPTLRSAMDFVQVSGKRLHIDVEGLGTIRAVRARVGDAPKSRAERPEFVTTEGDRLVDAQRLEELKHASPVTVVILPEEPGTSLRSFGAHPLPMVTGGFSPDGSRVVTGSCDSTSKIWDAATGVLQFKLMGHAARVLSTSFSSDGDSILTASEDGTVKVSGAPPTAPFRRRSWATRAACSRRISPRMAS